MAGHSNSNEVVLDDVSQPCPYLPGETARMPLRLPAQGLTAAQLDNCLAEGDRRSGVLLYRTSCPICRACEPIRLPVDRFVPGRTQRRIWNRGQREIQVELNVPRIDQSRVDLFNTHARGRGLAAAGHPVDIHSYASFLTESCCHTMEISYRMRDDLVAIAICDIGEVSVSAVYCCFDPRYGRYSPGTFSILQQIDFCRDWGKRYLYLGFYISHSPHMSYKSKFLPHERMIDKRWHYFDRSAHESATVRFSAAQVESET